MPRVPRPVVLLQRAVRRRSAGDLLGEEHALRLCVEQAQGLRAGSSSAADAAAARTARFYLALQGCQLGRFAQADAHLSALGLGARLSDAIWAEDCTDSLPPEFFVRVIDDGLPSELIAALRQALHPGSVYWEEHSYTAQELEFFSHAHRMGEEVHLVDQLIEALRPLLAQVAPRVAAGACLAEWWAHHRARDQWHGHPLHFDTHERLLRDSRGACVQHPSVSTVVYLSDASPRFGPTLVTSQRPREPGEVATLVQPRRGRVLFFDGSYLHGALPGRPWLAKPGDPERRLCIMVGWWTGALEPLPPSDPPEPLMLTDPDARWVRHLGKVPGLAASMRLGGQPQTLGSAVPVWRDVPTAARGEPFFGRFFLSHRGQVDADLLR